MGTNYYLKPRAAPEEADQTLHIGKSSGGWVFLLHVIPERGIDDLEDWKKLFEDSKYMIEDEYGREQLVTEMLAVICDRNMRRSWDDPATCAWFNSGHYHSEEEFHRKNCSQRGPKGLLRCRLSEEHCVKHGEGTWDCIVGEFS